MHYPQLRTRDSTATSRLPKLAAHGRRCGNCERRPRNLRYLDTSHLHSAMEGFVMRTRACRFFQFKILLAASLILISFAEQASAVGFRAGEALSLAARGEPLLDLASQI